MNAKSTKVFCFFMGMVFGAIICHASQFENTSKKELISRSLELGLEIVQKIDVRHYIQNTCTLALASKLAGAHSTMQGTLDLDEIEKSFAKLYASSFSEEELAQMAAAAYRNMKLIQDNASHQNIKNIWIQFFSKFNGFNSSGPNEYHYSSFIKWTGIPEGCRVQEPIAEKND